MNKNILFAFLLVIILSASFLVIYQHKEKPAYEPGRWAEADAAVRQAKLLFDVKKQAGENFSNGPCLSNDLMAGWVVDIAHNPRIAGDDLPENQCSAYLEGRAEHFVELDPYGVLIRVK